MPCYFYAVVAIGWGCVYVKLHPLMRLMFCFSRAVAQVARRLLLTLESWIQFQMTSREIHYRRSVSEAGFFCCLGFPLPITIPPLFQTRLFYYFFYVCNFVSDLVFCWSQVKVIYKFLQRYVHNPSLISVYNKLQTCFCNVFASIAPNKTCK